MSDYMTTSEALNMKPQLNRITGLAKGNTTVTQEQHRQILEEVVIAARQQMIARDLLGPDIVFYNDFGVQSVGYDTLTEMSAAQMDYKLTENEDTIGLARTNVPIPIIHKEFEIDARDLASSQRFGIPLSTSGAQAAAYRVAMLEDAALIRGHSRDGSTYEEKGFYESANNNYSTTADFGTAGKGISATQGGIALLTADNIKPPYNMVLATTQFNELAASIYTGGVSEIEKVQNMLTSGRVDKAGTNGGGLILSSDDLTAGTGMIIAAPGRGFYKYHVPLDLSTKLTILEKSENLWGRVMICGRLVIGDTNAICKLSDI
jgi:uncharacterized linocin/CFP29 family protein